VWWVLGPLVLMPAKLGMTLFAVNATAAKVLMGHLTYGLELGVVYARTRPRPHRKSDPMG
jgi:hypothetical protein